MAHYNTAGGYASPNIAQVQLIDCNFVIKDSSLFVCNAISILFIVCNNSVQFHALTRLTLIEWPLIYSIENRTGVQIECVIIWASIGHFFASHKWNHSIFKPTNNYSLWSYLAYLLQARRKIFTRKKISHQKNLYDAHFYCMQPVLEFSIFSPRCKTAPHLQTWGATPSSRGAIFRCTYDSTY